MFMIKCFLLWSIKKKKFPCELHSKLALPYIPDFKSCQLWQSNNCQLSQFLIQFFSSWGQNMWLSLGHAGIWQHEESEAAFLCQKYQVFQLFHRIPFLLPSRSCQTCFGKQKLPREVIAGSTNTILPWNAVEVGQEVSRILWASLLKYHDVLRELLNWGCRGMRYRNDSTTTKSACEEEM